MLVGRFCYLKAEPGWLFPPVSTLYAKLSLAVASYLLDRCESGTDVAAFPKILKYSFKMVWICKKLCVCVCDTVTMIVAEALPLNFTNDTGRECLHVISGR